ncbi:MAG: XdhC family protein [Betaproteobacteria bacterium]|nr:XdhC family protein [Betaproteobacteria bacterium]
MDSVDLEVVKSAVNWVAAGHAVTLVTIVKTWGSAPRPVGAMTVIRDDGHVMGSVSGGCVEDDLIDKVKAKQIAATKPEEAVYGVTTEQATRYGLPCGGTLELVLEPISARSKLPELLAIIEKHELVARMLDMKTGDVTLQSGKWSDELTYDGSVLKTVHGPRWRLLMIGAGQVSRYLANFAMALDYHVTVCDPREEYMDEWDLDGVTLTRTMPDDVVLEMNMDGHSAVVALTHDPKLDDLALMEALKSPAFYVGALGSTKNNDTRRKRLAEFDLLAEEIARLRGPVGLKLGGKTPPEIALSIIAEMTAVRRGVKLPELIPPEKTNVTAGCAVSAN